jgi:hypothetical protein
MTFDQYEDFKNQRWRYLALTGGRRNILDGSEEANTIDLKIIATRDLIRSYETLRGVWSRQNEAVGSQPRRNPGS